MVSEQILVHETICPLLVQLLARLPQLARPQHVCWSTSECSLGSGVVEAMQDMSIETLLFAAGLSITCCLLASNLGGFLSWLRTAWMLRKLPKSKSNRLYGGLLDMLSSNRLRAAQRMNEEIVSGSGVFYFNALWRQVGYHDLHDLQNYLTLVRVAHASITSADSSATLTALQTVVVSDPHLMAQLLHDNSLYKPARPDYIHFRQVSTHHQLCPSPLCICCC